MKSVKPLFIGVLWIAALPSLAVTKDPNFKGETVSEKNESICKTMFVQGLVNEQMKFSNTGNDVAVRRLSERRITSARQIFSETGSYCQAYEELTKEVSSETRHQKGEVHLGK
ncbi:hypothetical protein NF212_20135 [Parasalinivibrio latis]|uniref:hypothetical protein n=1 Tax=Parasalinivibrio latis TaxID=2952610 RepID=UPI0030E41E42